MIFSARVRKNATLYKLKSFVLFRKFIYLITLDKMALFPQTFPLIFFISDIILEKGQVTVIFYKIKSDLHNYYAH